MQDLRLTEENGDLFLLFRAAKVGDTGTLSVDYTVDAASGTEVQLKLSRVESNAAPAAEPAEDEAENCPRCGEPLNDEGYCEECGWKPGDETEKPEKSAAKRPFAVLIGR